MPTNLNDAKRRLHRIFGAFLAHEAWRGGADAVTVSALSLQRALGLQKLQRNRVALFAKDNLELFSYSQIQPPLRSRRMTGITLSRRQLSNPSEQRAPAPPLKIQIVNLPGEAEAVSTLALLAHGLRSGKWGRA